MSQELQVRSDIGEIEKVLVAGDLKGLSEQQRVSYYQQVCQSIGLNPLTKPFDYLVLNGKLQLYANKNAAEQLRRIYDISIVDIRQQQVGDVVTTIARGRDGAGREDTATASVAVTGLKGEALANAFMKCETKAKRRLSLSMCGLGMLDETEVDSISGAKKIESPEMAPPAAGQIEAPAEPAKPKASPFGLMVGDAAKKNGIKLETFIVCLFDQMMTFFAEALLPNAEADWKAKAAALSSVYLTAEDEDRDSIEEAIKMVPTWLKEAASNATAEVPA